ncbi:MAG TPA: DUF3489 domain-containing protein [Allosphingosinicella sp.]|jgi:hypothetical protein
MAKKPKLTDMQLVLLSTASQREDGNLFPVAESLKGGASRIRKGIEGLIERGYVAEGEVAAQVPSWREEGDRRLGAAITAAGRGALDGGEGLEDEATNGTPTFPSLPTRGDTARKAGEIRPGTKVALLVEMLERDEGASIQQIVEATGWLPHTTRAALTGLKKRGFEFSREKVEGVGRYHAERPA